MLNDKERATAAEVQQRLRRTVSVIRANPNLSPQGKRSAIARATLEARAGMAELRSASDARDSARRADLEFRLFGLGTKDGSTDVLAARDARDRASRIKTPGEAAQLLAGANRAGDTSMARAIFERAWDMAPADPGGHWAGVARSYLDNRPAAQRDAAELAGLLDGTSADRFRDRVATEILPPDEVKAGNLEALAAEPGDGPA